MKLPVLTTYTLILGILLFSSIIRAQDVSSPVGAKVEGQKWNWHIQNTYIIQGDPGFQAKYSGLNSLNNHGEVRETVSLDLYAGIRLWCAAEVHLDILMWQGFGLSNTVGVEGFPNGEAFKVGTKIPHVTIARLFIRQTIGLGGGQEEVPDDQLTLAGKQDASRITLTIGRFSAKDIFDNSAYANDPRTQFMNWALMANAAWDYPADSLGFDTGITVELNQPKWALRYGFFQMPRFSNSFTAENKFLTWPPGGADGPFLRAWGMVVEFERRYGINTHRGAIRFLAFLNQAHMGSYQAAIDNPARPANITATEAYRLKYGFGLNWEQEVITGIGIFSRLGWNDGHNEAWAFTDVNYTVSLGVSVKGKSWRRPDDTFGLAGVVNGISHVNRKFLEAGGTGILDGDGNVSYGSEKIIETYYDFKIWKTIHGAVDYQFVNNPAFNRDRGPVSILGVRLHWEF
jgi:high affinity Mn2+ porin